MAQVLSQTLLKCRGDVTRVMDVARVQLVYKDELKVYNAIDRLVSRLIEFEGV